MSHHRVKPTNFFLSCFTFLLFSNTLLYAQDDQLKFDRFTTENGLSSNVVYCILQDKKGWLWIGTNDGLSRYDGYSFKTYRSDPGDSSSLPANSVNALCEDQDGNLWIGTSKGVCKFNIGKNNFIKIPLLTEFMISQILKVNKHELLINSGGVFLTVDIHSLKSTHLQTSQRFREYRHDNIITRDNNANFYIPLHREDTTVIIKYESNQTFNEFLTTRGENKSLTNSRIFFIDSRNNYWIGTAIEGNLFHYFPSKGTGKIPANCLVKKGIGNINQIFEDKDGKIWIAAA